MRDVKRLTLFLGLLVIATSAFAKGQYLTSQAFLEQSFGLANDASIKEGSSNYKSKSIWLSDDDKRRAKEIFNRNYIGLRVRYWQKGTKTAWIMDEIGKTQPITVGVVIVNKQIEKVSILAFRESRGGEIRHLFFTQQFVGLRLQQEGMELSDPVDGITGATLSVRATTRVARFALYLSGQLVGVGQENNIDGLLTINESAIDE